ncbi:SGNH/GDSL hydrolase family protein [Vibrio sagamiensis]|uniref:SGNH/GDSL hydrolase family protein n=1 Tax=Vibrio sagamiensis TaxID=512650 RepID=UPI001D1012C6|nr:SGNH/GDSL hydrolase family protein [Vibrio sagamiensis]
MSVLFVFQLNSYALEPTRSLNIVFKNNTGQSIPISSVNLQHIIDRHTLKAKQTVALEGVVSLLLPEQCTQTKLYPNAVSADGSKSNWSMKFSSALDFTINMSGMGKAITWPNFTALDFESCHGNPAIKYQKWMKRNQDQSLIIGNNTINYKIAANSGAGSMQGTFIVDNMVIRWCSYNYDSRLNKCNQQISGHNRFLLNYYPSTNQTPTYYVTISKLPKNTTPYKEMFLFGDSLTDTHNSFALSGGDLPKGPFYNGRWSDGLMWPDYVSILTGIPVNNYAFGGMRISRRFDANLSSAIHLNKLGIDIVFMPSGLPMSPNLVDELTTALPHLKSQLLDATKERRILTTFLMGGNDFMAMAGGEIPEDYPIVFNSLARSIRADFITKLTFEEQEKLAIALFELPDITIAPQLYHSFKDGVTKTSFEDFQAEITAFNQKLWQLYVQLQNEYPHINFIHIATEKWLKDITYNRVKYGFSDGLYNNYYQHDLSSQIWGQPKTIENEPSENSSIVRSINDSSNFLGVFNLRGINETAGSAGVASVTVGPIDGFVKDSLIPYRPSLVNKAIVGGSVHPSTKTHFILAAHFIDQNLMSINNHRSTAIISDIYESKGFRPQIENSKKQAFNRLLDYSNQTHKKPDFAGCSPEQQCYFRNGNQDFVERDGFTPKVFKIINHTANPNCPEGNCSVFSVFNVQGKSRHSKQMEYLRLFPLDGSELTVPFGSYDWLNFNFKSPYTDFSVTTDKLKEHGKCKVLAVSHGTWGTTDGRCFNDDYTVCIAGKGC